MGKGKAKKKAKQEAAAVQADADLRAEIYPDEDPDADPNEEKKATFAGTWAAKAKEATAPKPADWIDPDKGGMQANPNKGKEVVKPTLDTIKEKFMANRKKRAAELATVEQQEQRKFESVQWTKPSQDKTAHLAK